MWAIPVTDVALLAFWAGHNECNPEIKNMDQKIPNQMWSTFGNDVVVSSGCLFLADI